jgi:hypothetical protein
MKRKIKECDVTIVNQEELMTGDGIFVDKEVYKENCENICSMKKSCGIAVDLLDKGKYKEALEIIKTAKK